MSKLKYELGVVDRALGERGLDEAEMERDAIDGSGSGGLAPLAAAGEGNAVHEALLLKYIVDLGLLDQMLLSMMRSTATMVGVDVLDAASGLRALFQEHTAGVVRGCAWFGLEGSAEFAREAVAAASDEGPWSPIAPPEQQQAHRRLVLRACLAAFPLRASIGRKACSMSAASLQLMVGNDAPPSEPIPATATDVAANTAAAAPAPTAAAAWCAARPEATVLQHVVSSNADVRRKVWEALQGPTGLAKRRVRSGAVSINKNRLNVQNGVTHFSASASRVDAATFESCDPGGLAAWALRPRALPSLGGLMISRAIMYATGAPGTVLAEPFDDSQSSGDGEGTGFVIGLVLRRAIDAGKLPTDAAVSVDGMVRALSELLGDDGSWIDASLAAGRCPESAQAFAAAATLAGEQVAGAWRTVTRAAVHTLWAWAPAETPFCDTLLRVILRVRKPKAFSLLKRHALAPWQQPRYARRADGKLNVTLHDLRDDVRAAGLTVPSDEQRHMLSAWREAPLDHDAHGLLDDRDRLRHRLSAWAAKQPDLALPATTAKAALVQAAWDHVHRHCVRTARQQGGGAAPGGARSEGDLLRAGATSLRLHADISDSAVMASFIQELRDAEVENGLLVMDTFAGEEEMAAALASRLPEHVRFVPCGPRRPESGVVTARALSIMPGRTGEFFVGRNTMTVACVAWRPHFVSKCVIVAT